MRIFATAAMAALLAGSVLCDTARAETIKDQCAREWTDNASYHNCIARLTQEQTQTLRSEACSDEACMYRLSCQATGDNRTTCAGSGYRVEYQWADTGNDITILDPDGRRTELFQCGTCAWLDYISGPLRDAEILPAGDDILLEVRR